MDQLWWGLGLCLIIVLGAALPLIKRRPEDDAILPPPRETLRDWRSEQGQ